MITREIMNPLLPKISIITPSLNQGEFLEDTILSVLGQAYPNLEYIILDGGSTDDSVEIIKRYQNHLTYWHSKKDNGRQPPLMKDLVWQQEISLAWLNSDDMYLPGTLNFISNQFNSPEPLVLAGNCIHLDQVKNKVNGSDIRWNFNNLDLELMPFTFQPSCFWNRKAWVTTGKLNQNYNFVFDWDWFIRARRKKIYFEFTDRYLSTAREK